MTLADTLRDRLGIELRDIAGATVAGEIPVSHDVVNRLIAERVRSHARISALHVEAHDGDTITIEIVPRVRLMPPVRLFARIDRQPEFPADPTLVLQWSMPAAGPLAMFAAPALSFFKKIPPGVRLDGDRLAVDLRELLRGRGHAELLPLIRRGAIHTRAGSFVVTFEVGL